MTYTYRAVRLTDGSVIEDLPDLSCDSVARQLGAYTQTTADLPLPTAPPDWRSATLPGSAAVILIDRDDNTSAETAPWGSFVVTRSRTGEDTISVSLFTLENAFDRRFVGDQEYDQQAPEAIMVDLANKYLVAGITSGSTVLGGLPLRIATTGATGLLVDRIYAATDGKTVYSVFQELSAIQGGPEWTVTWEISADQSRITPVLWIGQRIGNPVTPGLAPNASFSLPGNMTDFSFEEDYGSSNGGNAVTATSTASSDTVPESEQVVTPDPNRPAFEIRYSPTESLDGQDDLDSHAQAEAAAVLNGVNTLTMTGQVSTGIRLGVDWDAGDDIGYQVGGLDQFGNDTVPAFPGGISGVVRAIGWTLNPDAGTQSPILQDPGAS